MAKMTPEEVEEYEANYFAMHLLIPEQFIRKDLKAEGGIEIEDDEQLTRLAKKYQVSRTMMMMRLTEFAK